MLWAQASADKCAWFTWVAVMGNASAKSAITVLLLEGCQANPPSNGRPFGRCRKLDLRSLPAWSFTQLSALPRDSVNRVR